MHNGRRGTYFQTRRYPFLGGQAPVATLSASSNVEAGAQITVQWTGPANDNDYISIARTDQERGNQYETFRFVSEESNEVTLTVPSVPGNYEIRYILASDSQIIARQALSVEVVAAELTAPLPMSPSQSP